MAFWDALTAEQAQELVGFCAIAREGWDAACVQEMILPRHALADIEVWLEEVADEEVPPGDWQRALAQRCRETDYGLRWFVHHALEAGLTQQAQECLTDFDFLYRRLRRWGCAGVWEDLGSLPDTQIWREFWRCRQTLLRQSPEPHLLFLTLTESSGLDHPLARAARNWLERHPPKEVWLRLAQTPPLARVIPLPAEDFPEREDRAAVWRVERGRALAGVRGPGRWWDLNSGGEVEEPGQPAEGVEIQEGVARLYLGGTVRGEWHHPQLRPGPSAHGGELVVTVSQEGSQGCLLVWNTRLSEPIERLEVPWRQLEQLELSPDGQWLLYLAERRLLGFRLDGEGRCRERFDGPQFPWGELWHDTGRRQIRLQEGQLQLLAGTVRVATLARMDKLSNFSVDGPWALLREGPTASLWDLERCQRVCQWDGEISQKELGELGLDAWEGGVSLTHRPSGAVLAELGSVQAGSVRAVCARSLRCYYESSGGRWGAPRLRYLLSGRDVALPQPPAKPNSCNFLSRDRVLICNQDGDYRQGCPARLFDLSRGRAELRRVFPFPSLTGPVVVSQEEDWLATVGRDRTLQAYPLEEPEVPCMGHQSTILAMTLSADGRWLASGSTDQTVRVFDLDSGKQHFCISGQGAWAFPTLTADGRWLLVSSENGQWLWDLHQGCQVRSGPMQLSRQGLLTEVDGNEMVVTDLGQSRVLHRYSGHTCTVRSQAHSPYGPWTVSGDVEGWLRVWETASGREVASIQDTGHPIQEVAFLGPEVVGYYPSKNGNFHWTWGIRSQNLECGYRARDPVAYLGSAAGKSPDGEHSFSFERGLLTLRTRTQSLTWPQFQPTPCALFRKNRELLLGLDGGQILSFHLMGSARPGMACPPWHGLKSCRRVVVLGAGGSSDLLAAIPIYARLRQEGLEVTLATVGAHKGGNLLCFEPGGKKSGLEQVVSTRLGQPVYAMAARGPAVLRERFQELVERLGAEGLVLVDGDCDSLLRGDEPELGSPLEDLSALSAACQISLPVKLLVTLGLGVGTFDKVCGAYVVEAIGELTRAGAFLGSYSLLPGMPETDLLMRVAEGLESIATRAILGGATGQFGEQSLRAGASPTYVSALASLCWFFELEAVARRCQPLEWIAERHTLLEVQRSLINFRSTVQPRDWKTLEI